MSSNIPCGTREDETAHGGLSVKVSVLMFVYNHAAYLKRAIESVLAQQTDFFYEIIIHDDASEDGSADIIRSYAGMYPGRIIPILQNENKMSRGVSIVDEYIMPRVRGTYIAHCEGDDYWTDRRKLALQAAFLDAHPRYAGVTHNCSVVDADGHPGKSVKMFRPYKKPTRYTLQDLILEDRMPGQTATVMYRHSCQTEMDHETRNAYKDIRCIVGDRRRTLLILLNGPIFCMPYTLSAYRYVPHGGGSWNARIHGRNLSGRYYVQETDFRAFASKYYDKRLRNDYVLFGTGVMAHIRFFISRRDEDREQLRLVMSAHKSAAYSELILISYAPYAFFTLLQRQLHKILWS